MSEWIYRATAKKADWGTTDEALRTHHFLWRCAYAKKNKRSGVHQLIPNIGAVNAGDTIHVAFSWKARGENLLEGIGSFEVLDTPHPDLLSLCIVSQDSPLEDLLKKSKYTRDPRLGVFTGWHVQEVEKKDISFTKDMFPGGNSLKEFSASSAGGTRRKQTPPESPPSVAYSAFPSTLPTETGVYPGSITALGVDWSGSAVAGKKVWAALVGFGSGGRASLHAVWQPFKATDNTAAKVAQCFPAWLKKQSFNVAGLDFCFGVARRHAVAGMPTAGPSALGRWLERFQTPEEFKVAFGRELKRETDRLRNSPFAPTNLRMYRQTFWGLRALSNVEIPILPWGKLDDRVVVEVLPGHLVSVLARGCRYKGRTDQARAQRQRLLRAVEVAWGLKPNEWEKTILDDCEGDALDAVLAGIAAGAARSHGFDGVPSTLLGTCEGWIYSIPCK